MGELEGDGLGSRLVADGRTHFRGTVLQQLFGRITVSNNEHVEQ
jgi:hypothetical protein